MSITRIGIDTAWTSATNNTTHGITIPSDCTLAILGVSGYFATTAYFSGGTVAIGANNFTAISGADAGFAAFQACLWYRVNPPTGAQTLTWNWSLTGDATNGVRFQMAYYKGVNTSDLIHDSYGGQDPAAPQSTDTLTVDSGEMVIGVFGSYVDSAPTFSWTNLTAYHSDWDGSSAGLSMADAIPGGNIVVTADETGTHGDSGLAVIVVKAAATAGSSIEPSVGSAALSGNQSILNFGIPVPVMRRAG